MLFFICNKSTFPYFEDYYNSLVSLIPQHSQLFLFEDPTAIPISAEKQYICIQTIPYRLLLPSIKKIMINVEQLSRKASISKVRKKLSLGTRIYDYSLYNTLITNNPNHIYLPYQCYPKEDQYLSDLVKNTPKIYDIAFCNISGSESRAQLFTRLHTAGLKIVEIEGWTQERDQLISKCKILVNVHFHKTYKLFEHLRCDRWIFAGMIVVSETSLGDNMLDIKDLLITATYDKLFDMIVLTIANYENLYQEFLKKLEVLKPNIVNNRRNILLRNFQ